MITEAMLRDVLETSRVPAQLHDGVVRYLLDHVPPGHFLIAVLANNLVAACRRADPDCQVALFDLVAFLVNHAPAMAWGSPDAVADWLEARDSAGH